MKKIITSLSLLIASTSFSCETVKIAVVNPIEVFNNSNLGSVSVKKIENDLKPEAAKLEQQQLSIMKGINELKQNFNIMTEDQLKKNQQSIEEDKELFSKKLKMLQQKEYDKKEELSKIFQSKFDDSIKSIAKEKKYNLIMTTQALVYLEGVDDVSNKVILLMNKNIT